MQMPMQQKPPADGTMLPPDNFIPGGAGRGVPMMTSTGGGAIPQGAPPKSVRFRDKTVQFEKLEQLLKCGECLTEPATWDCKDCGESYCDECKKAVHSRGPNSKRQQHTNFVRMFVCRKCGVRKAVVECDDCEGRAYCEKCNKRVHGLRGRFRAHQAIESILIKYNTDPKKLNVDRDEDNGFNIDVKKQLVAGRFPSEIEFAKAVLAVLDEQSDPAIRVNLARALTPGVIDTEDYGKIDIEEVMRELKRIEGQRPPSNSPPPEGGAAAAQPNVNAMFKARRESDAAAAAGAAPAAAADEAGGDAAAAEPLPEQRPGSAGLPNAAGAATGSRPQSAVPANAELFIDTQTQKLPLGPRAEESCVGWRRFSRMYDGKICLFGGATNSHGNTAQLKRMVDLEKKGPKMRTASSFAAAAQLAPPEYSTAGLEDIQSFIPRFVDQSMESGVDEDGFNLGMLPAVLCKKAFSHLFLSMEYKQRCMYLFQFWTLLSKRDAVLEREALTKVQNVLIANAHAAPVSPQPGSAAAPPAGAIITTATATGYSESPQAKPLPIDFATSTASLHGNNSAAATAAAAAAYNVADKPVLTVLPLPDTRARVPEIPGGILSPSAQDEVFLQSPTRTRQHRAPDAFVPSSQKDLDATPLNIGYLLSVYGSHRVPVCTDDMIPFGPRGLPLFGCTENIAEGESWKVLLMKAFAKMYGSFSALNDANPVHVLKHMTGGQIVGEEWGSDVPFLYDSADAAAYVWWKIRATRRFGGMIQLFRSCGVEGVSIDQDEAAHSQSGADSMSDHDSTTHGKTPMQDSMNRPVSPSRSSRPTSATLPRPTSPTRSQRSGKEEGGAGAAGESSSDGVTLTKLVENKINLPVPEQFPAAWGTEACAFERGNTAESDGGAVVLFTRELLTKDASRLGVHIRPQQGAASWALTKLFQFGGAAGADRFSYSAKSPHWTKELRDYFDFRDSDNDMLYATPQDIVTAYDSIVTCYNYVGNKAPTVSFRLIPTPQAPSGDWSASILVALRSSAIRLRFEAEVYDFKRKAPVAAASGLQMTLRRIQTSTRAALHPLHNIDESHPTVQIQAVQQMIPALGQKITLPDKFEIADIGAGDETEAFVPGAGKGSTNNGAAAATTDNEEGDDESGISSMYVITITGQHRTDTLSGILSFNAEDVAFATLVRE